MSIERSHGKPRLQRARARRVSAPQSAASTPTTDERRPYRAARRHLSASLRARIAHGVAMAAAGNTTPQSGAEIARGAYSLYLAGQRELRTQSPIALSHLVRWAIGSAVASYLALEAAEVGPSSERGRALLELSMRLEGRAERASVAAATFADALRPTRGQRTAADDIEAAAERALAARAKGAQAP